MAIQIAQTNSGTSTLASTVITWTNNTVSGNTIMVAVGTNVGSDVSTITDSQGNAYVNAFKAPGTGIGVELWYSKNILGGAGSVTINYTSGATAAVVIREYSGIDSISVLDQTSTSSGNSGTLSSGATNRTIQDREICVGVGGLISGSLTAGGGYINLSQVANATINTAIEDLMVTSGGLQTATMTGTSGQWSCGVATFRASPQGTTTSTSSTSSTSSSTSSTSTSISSISTSSTSSSLSSTSTSASTSSTSISTSSTSSSISSTSSSISSTSISSTSSSTSVSSTSSSISSTSVSSTSVSSTSSSTSFSSLSTSFSSTSSSISSTSQSTSSTSVSSTSSSSSTSTTAIPLNIDYSYQDSTNLPSGVADETDPDVSKNYQNVAVDDGDYFTQYGSEFMLQEFKFDWTNNTDTPSFNWKGRTTYDTRISPILIQIFNVNSSTWETLATINTIPSDVETKVTVTQSTNPSNYYNTNQVVAFRIYQKVI